ncbi:MAG: AsmA family protein, partial [Lautropia sp.]|nr:AsmA family protein [Lautropia sp.]
MPLALVLFVVVSDLFGWAYLRKPVAAILSSQLDRPVEISPPFRINLRRSIPVQVGAIRIAAPQWSRQPHFVDIEGLEADMDWGLLFGRRPVLHRLAVVRADIRAERDAEGRASWSMGAEKLAEADAAVVLPVVEQLSLGQVKIEVDDALNELDLQIEARAGEGGTGTRQAAGTGQQAPQQAGLVVNGRGTWRKEPLSFALRTKGVRPITEGGVLNDIEVTGKLKTTELAFNGSVSDLATFGDVQGKVSAQGRSLGELTAIPGLTLPDTPPYQLEGDLQRSGSIVKVNVTRAEIGSSRMVAQLEYDSAGATPILRGSLNASRLVLQDLGPSIGASGANAGGAAGKDGKNGKNGKKGSVAAGQEDKGKAGARGKAGSNGDKAAGTKDSRKEAVGKDAARKDAARKDAARMDAGKKTAGSDASRVLPSAEFNLPSLRRMNADVAIDLKQLDLGTDALRPLQSLKAKLLLDKGVLKLQDLKSNLAGGTLAGAIVLDGSAENKAPVFDTRLKWERVDLKSWVRASDEYFIAGRFSGETLLKGTGNSTAAILGSLGGTIKGRIDGGSVSHLIDEIAGLDLANALGVFISGDKPLALSCALVDLSAEKGALRSNLLLFNTPETIFFVQGGVNLRN